MLRIVLNLMDTLTKIKGAIVVGVNVDKNRFDEKYDIRLAKIDEITEVMSFIDVYWKKGHILAKNRDFFEYEMVVDGKVNFLIAKSLMSGKIEGILGFLPCSKDQTKLDIWGVIWKTVPGAMPMLGMELKKRLMKIIGARTDLGVGANLSTSVPLLNRIYHYYTAKMKHYYRLADRSSYIIAQVNVKAIPIYEKNSNILVTEMRTVEELDHFFDFECVSENIPYKDIWYYNRRFYNHPLYTYRVWGIKNEGKRAIMVTRDQEYNGSIAVSIVDYIGKQELFGQCGEFFDSILDRAEFVDFYFDGFKEEYAKRAGFVSIDEYDNIIPNYFNPFEQRNVDIYVDSSDSLNICTFFKADGDQDRPN